MRIRGEKTERRGVKRNKTKEMYSTKEDDDKKGENKTIGDQDEANT